MIRIRLIYEQIEAAKSHLEGGSVLGWRRALILLDNAAEILMHRELEAQFAFDDHLMPKWEPLRTDWIARGHGPKYSAKERQEAERNFRPKMRVLCTRLGRISDEDRQVLDVPSQVDVGAGLQRGDETHRSNGGDQRPHDPHDVVHPAKALSGK